MWAARWRLVLGWAGCALLAGACLALDPEPKCNRTEYEAHGKCCRKCSPGHKVKVLCSKDNDTDCLQCQPGHFQDSWTKQTVCTPHRYCDQNAGLVVHSQGDAKQNVVCRCQHSTHCSSAECQSCRENKVCVPGEGVEQTATDMKDTICAACPPGFFSNISSATAPCQPWSSCRAVGLVQKASGTRFSDVICEEPRRTRSLAWVLVPLAALVVVALGSVGLCYRHHRRLPKSPQNEPAEDEDPEASSALPIQETDGKDSHLAEQEHA